MPRSAPHPVMAGILTRGATSRENRVVVLLDRLDELDFSVDREFVASLAGGIPSREHVAAGMVRAGHAASDDEAFARFLNEGGPAHIQRYRPTIKDTIAAVRDAGGVSVIAHPRGGKGGPGCHERALRRAGCLRAGWHRSRPRGAQREGARRAARHRRPTSGLRRRGPVTITAREGLATPSAATSPTSRSR